MCRFSLNGQVDFSLSSYPQEHMVTEFIFEWVGVNFDFYVMYPGMVNRVWVLLP